MSELKIGPKAVTALRLGSKPVNRIMLGRKTVWNAVQVYDDFNRPDCELDDDGTWVNHGPSLDHVASVVNNRCRLGLPDNFTAGVFERISYMRYAKATSPTEDGYVEALVATMGDSTKTPFGDISYQTHVYGRVSNTGFTAGVGLWFSASEIGLVVRQGLKDTVVQKFGAYSPGDIVRVEWKGKTYTLFRSGRNLGTWTDSQNMVATGTGNRSLGLRVHAAKEQLGLGPRRFSAALDYVEYG